MTKIFGEIKDKKFLFFAAAASVILTTAVFLFSYLAEKEKAAVTVQSPEPKGKSMEDLKKEFSTPVNPDIESVPVSSDFTKSLSVPVEKVNARAAQAAPTPTPAPVSEDFLKNLSKTVK